MVNFHPTKKSKHAIRWKHLLGKTIEEIMPYTGEPFASYLFHSEEVYLYDKGSISTIVLRNGMVICCDDLAETRRTIRVKPAEKVPAMLIGERKLTGYLKDISVAGAAFHHSNEADFPIGSRIEISFSLSIEGVSRYFEISGRIHEQRIFSNEKATVVLFDLTDDILSKRLLSRYVQLSSIRSELGLQDLFVKKGSAYPDNFCR
jgi:hypothetical protein